MCIVKEENSVVGKQTEVAVKMERIVSATSTDSLGFFPPSHGSNDWFRRLSFRANEV